MAYHGLSWLIMTCHDLGHHHFPITAMLAVAPRHPVSLQFISGAVEVFNVTSWCRVYELKQRVKDAWSWADQLEKDLTTVIFMANGQELKLGGWKKMSNFFCSQDMSCLFLVFSPDESAYSKQHDHNIFTLLFVWVSLNLVVPHLHGPGRMRRRSWNGALTQWTPTFRCISASTRQNVGVTQRPLSWACS